MPWGCLRFVIVVFPDHTHLLLLKTGGSLVQVKSIAICFCGVIYCFMYLQLFVKVLCWSLFLCVLLYVLSSFAIILTRKRELVALLLLSFGSLVTINVL